MSLKKTLKAKQKTSHWLPPPSQRPPWLHGHLHMSMFAQPPFGLSLKCCKVNVGADPLRCLLGNDTDTSTQARTFRENNDECVWEASIEKDLTMA